MSGTSLDAIDAALVAFQADKPPALIHALNYPIPPAVRSAIAQLSQPGDNEINRAGELDVTLGKLFADAVAALLESSHHSSGQIRAIGSHGQTVRHHPARAFTLQIADPNTIAYRTGITTVADFRRMDMAAGGQGAPLVPAFHDAVLRSDSENRAVVNIGGMANVTVLAQGQSAYGFDTGPGNVLMDGWVQRHLQHAFDKDGDWAESGTVQNNLLEQLLAHPFIAAAPPKSTGREDFHPGWLDTQLAVGSSDKPADIQRTLLEFTARSISDAIAALTVPISRVLLCGGGSHNGLLRRRISELLPNVQHNTTTDFGIDADWLEAMAFAWLAHQRLSGKAGNVPAATGASRPCILGGVYDPY